MSKKYTPDKELVRLRALADVQHSKIYEAKKTLDVLNTLIANRISVIKRKQTKILF